MSLLPLAKAEGVVDENEEEWIEKKGKEVFAVFRNKNEVSLSLLERKQLRRPNTAWGPKRATNPFVSFQCIRQTDRYL